MNKQKFFNYVSACIFVMLVVLMLCLPHKKENVGFVGYTGYQKTARIDIKNEGQSSNSIQILKISDKNAKINTPAWFSNDKGKGFVVDSRTGKLDFEIKAINDGKLFIKFRGVDYRDSQDKKRKIPVCIELLNISINGNTSLSEKKVIWYDSPYDVSQNVKDGEIVKVHLEWRPFVAE